MTTYIVCLETSSGRTWKTYMFSQTDIDEITKCDTVTSYIRKDCEQYGNHVRYIFREDSRR